MAAPTPSTAARSWTGTSRAPATPSPRRRWASASTERLASTREHGRRGRAPGYPCSPPPLATLAAGVGPSPSPADLVASGERTCGNEPCRPNSFYPRALGQFVSAPPGTPLGPPTWRGGVPPGPPRRARPVGPSVCRFAGSDAFGRPGGPRGESWAEVQRTAPGMPTPPPAFFRPRLSYFGRDDGWD